MWGWSIRGIKGARDGATRCVGGVRCWEAKGAAPERWKPVAITATRDSGVPCWAPPRKVVAVSRPHSCPSRREGGETAPCRYEWAQPPPPKPRASSLHLMGN